MAVTEKPKAALRRSRIVNYDPPHSCENGKAPQTEDSQHPELDPTLTSYYLPPDAFQAFKAGINNPGEPAPGLIEIFKLTDRSIENSE